MSYLLPFQDTGSRWLAAHQHGVLADDMGLGKTIQAIAALDTLAARRVLVICPAIARANWVREHQKFAIYDRRFVIVDDDRDATLAAARAKELSLVMSYERAVSLHQKRAFFELNPFDVLIMDEGHYLKNPFAQRTMAVLGKQGLHHCAKYLWALTGTPVTRDVGDLWPYLFCFGATKFPYERFVGYYCHTKPHPKHAYMRQIVGVRRDRLRALQELISKVVLRRTIAQVMPELPEVTYEEVTVERGPVEITDEMREKLRAETHITAEALAQASSDQIVGALEMLAKSCSTLRRYLGLQKVQPAVELVRHDLEAEYYGKIVIFFVHKDVGKNLCAGLNGGKVLQSNVGKEAAVLVYGDTPAGERQHSIDRFQNDPTCHAMVASIGAASTAITLTAGHHILFVERDWTVANNDQAVGRCRRMGQQHPVHVRTLTVANSIDEAVERVLRRRQQHIAQVVSS